MRAPRTGTIERTGDGRYRARLPSGPGLHRATIAVRDTREEAQLVLDAFVDAARGAPSEVGSVADWCSRVVSMREAQGHRNTKSERSALATHVAGDPIGRVLVVHVTRAQVREWLGRVLAKGRARQTNANVLNLLRVCLEVAAQDGAISDNPARGVKLRRARETGRDTWTVLTQAEVRALAECEAIPAEERAAILFAIYTGLRQGEQWSLARNAIFPDGENPHVVVKLGSEDDGPKSGKRRTVPLFGVALAIAKRLGGEGSGLAFPRAVDGVRRRNKGAPHGWASWLRAAGIVRRVRWQDLRHTCCSALVEGRWGRVWSLEEVRQLAGHSTVKVTERYAHFAGGLLAKAGRETQEVAVEDPVGKAAEGVTVCKTVIRRFESDPRLDDEAPVTRPSRVDAGAACVADAPGRAGQSVSAAVILGPPVVPPAFEVDDTERFARGDLPWVP